jgi:hypothetical protein
MSDKYENLKACCDGTITVEKLERFEQAMVEFKEFVTLAAAMFRPVSDRERADRRSLRD